MLLSLVFSSLSRSSDAAFMYALLPCRRPPAKCSSPTFPRLYPPPPRASAGAASAIRNNAQLRVINEVGRIEWAFRNYSASCSKVIAAYFGASVRSIASFAAKQADDRQRGLVPRLFGVAAITVPSNAAAMGGALRATSNELFGAATLAFIKATIDLNDAGVDRSPSCLEFHITDHHRTGLWINFPMPKKTAGPPQRQNERHDAS
jgi:hypothetical protein